ncbi:MAG: TfoX/Sxy family protein [Ruminococcus sp.]|nr:TfoX/Sxy family protein [Ruminococcus sp.]
MASSKSYLEYILEQLSALDDISFKAMMGEYIIYYRGKIAGGIYDDRFLVKRTEASERLMPDAPRELPYDGAKEMLLVEETDDREFLCSLFEAMYEELPSPRKRK